MWPDGDEVLKVPECLTVFVDSFVRTCQIENRRVVALILNISNSQMQIDDLPI